MLPGLGTVLGGGSGGFSGSSSADSESGAVRVGFGGFTFQPKGGNFPPAAWLALGAAAVAAMFIFSRRGR